MAPHHQAILLGQGLHPAFPTHLVLAKGNTEDGLKELEQFSGKGVCVHVHVPIHSFNNLCKKKKNTKAFYTLKIH